MPDDNTFGAAALFPDGSTTPGATMLDGTVEPLSAGTPDQPALGVLRQQAMGKIAELKSNEQFRALLLAGDAHALAEVKRLERIIKSPTGTFYGGLQTPAEVEQHQEAWKANADIGVMFGADVEQQLRAGQPISESEHRMAQARLAELKSDKAFLVKYFDGNVRARAEFQLLHRMLQLPLAPEKK
jgi:hypothetical protein